MYKSNFFILLLIALTLSAYSFKKEVSNDIKINWLTIEEAYKLNQKEPRKIFIDVYTDWCGWCKKMDRDTFSDPKVAEFVTENFYAVKLNAEDTFNIQLADDPTTPQMIARSMGVSGYPTIVYMKEDFKTIHVVPGYQKAGDFLTNLENVLKWK
ncbi:MAG: thioredoxin-related protein [Marivirga sp.]|jgi:thioredoxin-related protein